MTQIRASTSSPKHRQLKEALVSAIRSGEFTDRLPSIREMMHQHRVSYVTVTKALGDLRNMGLIEHRWGKGIFVREAKQSVRNVAVTFNGVFRASDPRMVRVLQGITSNFPESDWHMQLYPLPGTTIFGGPQPSLLSALLEEKRVDALISVSPHPPEDMERLQEMCVPVVNVSNEYPSSGMGCVMLDVADAATKMLTHLVDELGRSRIHFILGPRYPSSSRLVRTSTALGQALVYELRQRGLNCPPGSIFHSDYEWTTVEPIVRQWLSAKNPPDAIIVADQYLPGYVFNLAGEMGVKVPDDLAIIGLGPELTPEDEKVSSFVIPFEKMGAHAVAMMERISGGEPPTIERLPGEFVIRG